MRIRLIAIFLLAFQAFFLNVVVPGHTRGRITLSGRPAATPSSTCCHPDKKHESPQAPTPKERAECAVCHVAARITTTPNIDLRLTELGLLEVLPLPPPQQATSVELLPAYYGRAPPAV